MIAKTEVLGGCTILRVSGRIDFESALDFEHHINVMIQEAGDCYIIELSQVELLSSAGLRVMLSTAKRVAQRNASLALAAPSQVVRQVFEISHFNLLFKIFASVPDAIAALKGTSAQVEPDNSDRVSPPLPTLNEEDQANSSNPVIPSAELTPDPPLLPKAEAERTEPPLPSATTLQTKVDALRSESLPPVVPSSPPLVIASSEKIPTSATPPLVVPRLRESSPVTPPPLPPSVFKAAEASAAPGTLPAQPARQTSLPPPAKQSVSVSPANEEMRAERPAGLVARREAKLPAQLEVRAEGASYPCEDGDVIGTDGRLAKAYFSQIANLAPRHLLIGKIENRWFVFTPKNVQHPFTIDGVVLRAGERKFLQYVEHQVEFSGHVFGFRLVPQQKKQGFLSRFFQRKR
jgi:anti-sigma B factor antagonist